jgi:3-hydroxyisobutyrate dehydrogenase-like beta-hydroxyacid dehydrogenase
MDKTVGIIGLGITGDAISRNLVERRWRVIGFDTDARRRSELAQVNVEVAADVGEVVRAGRTGHGSVFEVLKKAIVTTPRSAKDDRK